MAFKKSILSEKVTKNKDEAVNVGPDNSPTSFKLSIADKRLLLELKTRIKKEVSNPKKISNVAVLRALLRLGADTKTDRLMKSVRQSFADI